MSTGTETHTATRTMKASEFKAKCLKLMDEVAAGGDEIVVTKNGRPTAKLVAYRKKPRSLYGAGRGRMKIIGDIVSPVELEWEAETDPDRVLNP